MEKLENIIITGTRSRSIADRAVAATMGDRVKFLDRGTEGLPEGITQAYQGVDQAAVDEFLEKLGEIKAKWAVRYKLLKGLTTSEKRQDYRVLVIGWAQENGAPDFTLTPSRPPRLTPLHKRKRKKRTGAQPTTIIRRPSKDPIPLDLNSEFSPGSVESSIDTLTSFSDEFDD